MTQPAEAQPWTPSKEELEIIQRIERKVAEYKERLKASTVVCSVPGCGKKAPFTHSEGTYQIALRVYTCPDGHETFVR